MTENKPLINDERRASGFASLSSTILPFAKSILGKKGFVEIDIPAGWSKIVGDELASWSVPQKIDFKKGSRTGGILHLCVPSGAFALEIQHREKFILEKINTYFGYNAVSQLKIIQNSGLDIESLTSIHQPPEKKTLVTGEEENYINSLAEEVSSPMLKEILVKLGKSVFSDNKSENKTK